MKMRDFLETTVVTDKVTRMQSVYLDYLSSAMNNPRHRIQRLIPEYEPRVILPEYEFSPDLLSEDVYGTNEKWWVILRYNGICNIFHPTTGFVANRLIKIPNAKAVDSWLDRISSNLDEKRLAQLNIGQAKYTVTI